MDKPYRSLGGGYKRRSTSLLPSTSNKVINNKLLKKLLQSSIILLVLYYELGTFYQHVSTCQWDDSPSLPLTASASSSSPSTSSSKTTTTTTTTTSKPHHVLIIADPQLIDIYSYPNRPYLIKLLTIWITDLYAKKSWWFVINFSTSSNSPTSSLLPSSSTTITTDDPIQVEAVKQSKHQTNSIIFLGDLLDSGILTSSSPLLHSLQVAHFHSLFPLPTISQNSTQKVPTIILPGNHDLGLHLPLKDGVLSQARNSRIRFEEAFGKVSGVQELGGWEFVWVDSMALLELGEEGDRARNFVSSISERKPNLLPRILLTHIPLFRPEGTSCGKNRESSRTIKQGAGKNYQNELDQATSEWLLRALKPLLVYSGDDHDSCIINHELVLEAEKDKKDENSEKKKSTTMSIKESTIKAFSMAMGVRRPGYHLLSIYPPSSPIVSASADDSEKKVEEKKVDVPIYTQTNCELPDQLGIWINIYGVSTAILFLSLILLKFLKRFILPYLTRSSINNSTNSTPTKRRVISAKSNGQSIHTHKKSISRTIGNFLVRNSGRVGYKFDGSSTGEEGYRISSSLSKGGNGGNDDGSGEEEEDGSDRDEDGIFPTFHSTASGSTGGGGMNHRNDFQLEYDEEPEMSSPYAGAGYDRNGTSNNSNNNDSRNGGGGNNNVNGNGSRRKLSRVWSKGSEWEKGEPTESSTSLTGITRSSSNSYSNSILARIFIKPIGRQISKIFKFFKLNVLFNAFFWIGKMLGLGLFYKIAVEVGELVMGGIMIWAAIAFWFWF